MNPTTNHAVTLLPLRSILPPGRLPYKRHHILARGKCQEKIEGDLPPAFCDQFQKIAVFGKALFTIHLCRVYRYPLLIAPLGAIRVTEACSFGKGEAVAKCPDRTFLKMCLVGFSHNDLISPWALAHVRNIS